jgi:hypothetical protein
MSERRNSERRVARGWRWLKHALSIEGCAERRKAGRRKSAEGKR